MREILKPALVLLAICAGVTIVLALVFQGTKPIIAERAAADLTAAKSEVLAGADAFSELKLPEGFATDEFLQTICAVYLGTNRGLYRGVVVRALSRGYEAAGVLLTIGLSNQGVVTGIRVGDHKETPGLGTKVLDKAQAYLGQYLNLKLATNLLLVKNKGAGAASNQIDAVTGATITSRAVWRAVQGALEISRKLTPEGAWK